MRVGKGIGGFSEEIPNEEKGFVIWEGFAYRSCWIVRYFNGGLITVAEKGFDGRDFGLVNVFRVDNLTDLYPYGRDIMASRFLKAAAARRNDTGPGMTGAADPALFKDRPAIEEFMRLSCDDDGKPRELSALMIVMDEGGIKAGLKDEQAGWCWRTGKTLSKALDAIEAALQGDEPAFRRSRQGSQGKGRK